MHLIAEDSEAAGHLLLRHHALLKLFDPLFDFRLGAGRKPSHEFFHSDHRYIP